MPTVTRHPQAKMKGKNVLPESLRAVLRCIVSSMMGWRLGGVIAICVAVVLALAMLLRGSASGETQDYASKDGMRGGSGDRNRQSVSDLSPGGDSNSLPNVGSSQQLTTLLVATVVEYSQVPAFLVAARSIYERSAAPGSPSAVRFAVSAGDFAWREIASSCSCYLPPSECSRILRVPWDVDEAFAKGSRRLLSEADPRWMSPELAASDSKSLAALASCSALVPEGAVLVLPDPHALALGNVKELLLGFARAQGEPAILVGGHLMGRKASGIQVAKAPILLVHAARWRRSVPDGALACPLNGQRSGSG